MPVSKSKRPTKPTVFLSHCSSNRRELLALKRFLDGRAGGLIEFFLSSDDDSIAHGTIWPAEVRAALDRMSLMLIFVSSEALKSGWTYFEAGYGLHKLGTANIYCLPGTDKASLPSPFNSIQNRNLHSAREVGLLVRQLNEVLGSTIGEDVTKDDFDRIFKRPSLGHIETGPAFDQLVESVTVKALGPPDSIEVFSHVCRSLDLPVSTMDTDPVHEQKYSTGVRMSVGLPFLEEEMKESQITDEMRKEGHGQVRKFGPIWMVTDPSSGLGGKRCTLGEIEAHNTEVRKQNEKIRQDNSNRQIDPRECVFTLSPINVSLPISIVDHWLGEVGIKQPLVAEVGLRGDVACEDRVEAMSAKIHGSQLSLREDGKLLWEERIVLELCSGSIRCLTLTAPKAQDIALGQFHIQELVSTLFELNILSLPSQRGLKRKR